MHRPENALAWSFICLALAVGLLSGYILTGDCFGEPLWRVLVK